MGVNGEDAVSALLSLLPDAIETVDALRARNDYFPEVGSPAHKAWIHIQMPGKSVAYHAFEAASAQVGAAEDEILALYRVLEEGDLSVAPYVLARAAIETCGRAYVLLDPALSDRERSALGLGEKLFELRKLEELCTIRQAESGVQDVLTDVRRHIGDLRRTAKRHGVVLSRRLGVSAAIAEILGEGDDDAFGLVAAVSYSTFVHAVPRMLMAHAWDLNPRMGHEWGVGSTDMGPLHKVSLSGNALVAYSKAVDRQIEGYGWPVSAWERWKGHARATIRRSLKTL